MTHDELVAEVQAAGIDIDTGASRISRWLNHLIREAALDSGWLRGTPQIGLTVANQADYAISSNFARLRGVKVGTGDPYERISLSTLWDINSGRLIQGWGSRNFFVEDYSADGTVKSLTLYPTPVTGGDQITGDAILYPTTISGGQNSPLPDDFDMPLIHGCLAVGLSFGDEDNNNAQFHQAQWEQGKEKLRRLANSRFSSPGGKRVLLKGFDFA